MNQVISYPRAAVIGNPSDGYNGKTIAFVFSNYKATAEVSKHDQLVISDQHGQSLSFTDCMALKEFVKHHGYDHPSVGNLKLAVATIHHLFNIGLLDSKHAIAPTFKIKFTSSIPRGVGLAGSSAIITAIIKVLYQFNNIAFQKPLLPNTVLRVETEELNIAAGLQDRVAQVYEKPVIMDFDRSLMDQNGHGHYEPIHQLADLNWYIAFPTGASENSDITHRSLRSRYDSGEVEVVQAMLQFSDLSNQFKSAIAKRDISSLHQLINQNFDLRKSIMLINPLFAHIVHLARSVGASAKFTGSGGAIIGLYHDEAQFNALDQLFQQNNIKIIKPNIVSNG